MVIAVLINISVALEISQGVARYFTETDSQQDKSLYVSTALWFNICAYCLFILLAVLFRNFFAGILLDSSSWGSTIGIAAAAVGLFGVFGFMQDMLRWQLQPKSFAVVALFYAILSASVSITLVVWFDFGVAGIFSGQIVGALFGIVLSWYLGQDNYSFDFSWERCKRMLMFSVPLVPSSIAVFGSLYVDRLVIKELLGLDSVGIYGVGYRFASIVGLAVVGFQSALTPIIFHRQKDSRLKDELAKAFRLFVLAALTLMLVIGVFSKEILLLMVDLAYFDAWIVMPVLSFGIIFGSMYIFAPGLLLEKRTKIIAGINICVAIGNLALNLLLIPAFGIIGAAISTTIAAFGGFFIQMVFSQRLFPVKHIWKPIIISTLFVITILIGVSIFFSDIDTFAPRILLYKFMFGVVAMFIIGYLLVPKVEFANLISKLLWASVTK